MVIRVYFHTPALLGEGFGLSGCAISWNLGTLGVRQLLTSYWSLVK